MFLNDLQFMSGSMKNRKRSRGNSGKSNGRGLKGQKARSGVSLSNFQGGQTPIERRIPKHNSIFRKKTMIGLPLSRLNSLLEANILDSKTLITRDLLEKFKLVRKTMKYKLIGSINKSIAIEADAISDAAKNSIISSGGTIKIIDKE